MLPTEGKERGERFGRGESGQAVARPDGTRGGVMREKIGLFFGRWALSRFADSELVRMNE